jgi:hypothetical protein
MPRRLLDRCQPDCIREFRAAATQRFDDGLSIIGGGRRLGAIYLWGYCAEMTLKAAYFTLIGLADTTAISWNRDIRSAIDRGRNTFHIAWPYSGQGHNVRAWAELLVAERVVLGVAYPVSFGVAVQRHGQCISQLWNETLRYHKNVAYVYEVTQVREATEWLLGNATAL